MGRGRAFASGLAIALVIGLCGACGSGSSKPSAGSARSAAQTKEIAATRAKVAAAKGRLSAARARVAAQHRTITEAIQRHLRRTVPPPAPKSDTTTTKPPKVVPARPPAVTTTVPAVVGSMTSDLGAIQRMVGRLNAAFAKSVAQGIAASETANYYVSAGLYTAAQCAAFEAARGDGAIAESLLVQPGTVRPTPGWVDDKTGSVPPGRTYEMAVDETQTLVDTGETRVQSFRTHVVVGPDGQARLFLRCA